MWGTQAAAAKSLVKMYRTSRKVQGGKEEDPKASGKDMATFFEGAWHMSVVDVESTLRHVCKKVRRAPLEPSRRP